MDTGGTAEASGADVDAGQLDSAWQAVVGSIAAARRQPGDTDGDTIGVTVLTGFLGSGKTTVLRQLLIEPAGLRIAAVVNDIGAVNVDAISVAAISGNADSFDASAASGTRGEFAASAAERIELTNGCACCALVDDLAESLERLAAEGTYDAIVVEASGAADPATMAAAVLGAEGCQLDGVIAVVDALHAESQLDDPRIGPAVRRQMDTAHLVVLSKVDLIDTSQAEAVTARIGELAPGRMVIPAACGRIDPRVLLSAATRGAALGTAGHGHPFEVATATVRPAGPWTPASVGRWFENQSQPLLRAKGWFTDPDGCPHELQAVGRSWRIHPAATDDDEITDPVIVLIGDAQQAVERAAASLGRIDDSDRAKYEQFPEEPDEFWNQAEAWGSERTDVSR